MCPILLFVASVFAFPALADLDTAINRAILEATKHDTTRSDRDKLFKNRCQTIAKYIGFDDTPSEQARKYSCDVPGIGIALYAGKDLGKHSPEKVGQYFTDKLAEEGLQSQVFVEPEHPYGASMGFYINGSSWLLEPVRPSKGVKEIDALAAEAKLILLTNGRVSEWIHAPKKK
ncbi:MAG: hypothetical protein AB2551_11010 [Candidatus Thiodiazotropha sp.]